jgi:hypothetical protein
LEVLFTGWFWVLGCHGVLPGHIENKVFEGFTVVYGVERFVHFARSL